MKSKSKEEVKYTQLPTTQAQANYDTHVNKAYDTADPTIPYTFGNMRENVNNRLDNPFGFNYSPEVSGAIRHSSSDQIDQAQGAALRQDAMNRAQAKTGALYGSVQGHAPVVTERNTTTDPGLGSLLVAGIGAGASLGSAAMT